MFTRVSKCLCVNFLLYYCYLYCSQMDVDISVLHNIQVDKIHFNMSYRAEL